MITLMIWTSVVTICLSEKSDTLLLISTLESEAILYNWRYNRVERIYKPWFSGMDHVESLVSLERKLLYNNLFI